MMTTALRADLVTKMTKVLFVCTGNTCRSPMAEALFNHYTKDINNLCASSCGIYSDGVSQISENAKRVLAESGISLNHISTPISETLVKDADYVVGMTANHAQNIMAMFPNYTDKVYTMPSDISDPYGGDIVVYRNCKKEIEEGVKILLKVLAGDDNG